MEDCENCVKLGKEVAKLEAAVTKREGELEKALDDLSTTGGARDEAIKKANRLAKSIESAGADADETGGDDKKKSIASRIANWPFGA